MQVSLKNNEKELIITEPYVIYFGFELGRFPKDDALEELRVALESFYQIVILVDDLQFSKDLLSYIQDSHKGVRLREGSDLNIFQKASLLIKSNLFSSLPESPNHPALIHIQNSFFDDVTLRVAPRLINSQVESWGLKHKRIRAFSRTKLEKQVR